MEYIVQDDATVYQARTSAPILVVETRAWYAWLGETTAFTYKSQYGTFSARREPASNGRGGDYWRAYRKYRGKLYRVYLGKNEQLTIALLNAAAKELARRIEPGAEPCEQSPSKGASEQHGNGDIGPGREVDGLLHTKCSIPTFHRSLIARPQLVQRLNQGMKHRLILLSALAGAGKTTLLSEWAHQSSALIAWIALDKEDNDSTRFWSYLIAALQRASLSSVGYLLETLRVLPLPPLQSVLSELLNILATRTEEIVIVLDDYHLIETRALHDSLVFFLEHLPPHIHLVIASRHEPPFSLARLRASRQLFELQSTDLSFSRAEAALFFAQAEQLSMTANDLARLVEQTEGWVAGLQLVALSLHEQQDMQRFLASFTGNQRFILNYLLDEVFNQQPPQVQRFLLDTSILERFTVSLCNVLTGENDGQAMLEYLAHKNLFLFPLGDEGRWYRYHHLLTEALSSRLQQTQPERFLALQRLAAGWYEQQDMLEEAVKHALAATDFGYAANLLERLATLSIKQHEFVHMARWWELLPTDLLAKRPRLLLAFARIFIASGQMALAEECLQNLAESVDAQTEIHADETFRGRIAALYAHFHTVRGETQAALEYANRALDLLPGDDLEWRMDVRAGMGGAYLHSGNLVEAEQALNEVVTYNLQQKHIYSALRILHTLGQTQTLLGRLDLVNETYVRGAQIASQYGLTCSAVMGHIHAGHGALLHEWNDLEAALGHLMTGIELARRGRNSIQMLDCMLSLADVKVAQGQTQEALATLQQAERLAHEINDPFFIHFVTRRPTLLWLVAGDVETASRCARATGLYRYSEVEDITTLPATFFLLIELFMLAHLYVAQGDLVHANKLLMQLQQLLSSGPNKRRRIQWLILQALALHREGRIDEAIAALAQALELAEPAGYIRTFIDIGSALLPLLKILSNLTPLAIYSLQYVRQLLTALGEPVRLEMRVEAFGKREFMVLRLLAEGYSDQQIAQHLVLSENTVKTHTKHIYSKLHVHSRTQAVARAREQGLL